MSASAASCAEPPRLDRRALEKRGHSGATGGRAPRRPHRCSGLLWYGVSLQRISVACGATFLDRPGGPMTFRFILQPAMAIIAALRDGVQDARLGRRPYVWALIRGVRDPQGRSGRLWEGDRLDGEDPDPRRRDGHRLPMGGVQDVLSGPGGGDRDLAGVCSLSRASRSHSRASRAIGSRRPASS